MTSFITGLSKSDWEQMTIPKLANPHKKEIISFFKIMTAKDLYIKSALIVSLALTYPQPFDFINILGMTICAILAHTLQHITNIGINAHQTKHVMSIAIAMICQNLVSSSISDQTIVIAYTGLIALLISHMALFHDQYEEQAPRP